VDLHMTDLRNSRTKNTNPNLEITDCLNHWETGNCLKMLLRKLRDFSLMTKFKKSYQKIADLGILWTGSKSVNYLLLKLFNLIDDLASK